ncbi:cytochrome d ubiquinol oxidase subunit II [Thiocapsa rosea]|uniref:Cytochrome bd-I ubiquinol oxidase subunit 2 apoprotein n=1 Tax=Thiocapsa rosea TaxID=69360 RepID=A0A495VFY8_9GAMM|nr:cytochrome d ubiquinol oxidase subunit II [Thiocapsa rosea]RKT47365.1 cytochrome bd-I ubiquinol oxidase subunit 2 apoprotein [Thiocapsa rosea]
MIEHISFSLPLFWSVVLAFAILVYVLLDGFDLGVGILFALDRDETHRQQMMGSIAPVWDGNETWLVLIGTTLFGAFPVVYAIFLAAFYLPVALLLVALILRGVAFEFRYKDKRHRWLWDLGFVLGSVIAAFIQGAAIGAMVAGIAVQDGRFIGGPFDWLSPFSVLCGLGLVVGYALLGAGWLVLKTEGGLRDWAYAWLPRLLAGVIGVVVLALTATLVGDFEVVRRWLAQPWLFAFPLLASAAAWGLWRGVQARRDWQPWLMASALFVTAFAMLAGSFWPWIVPYHLTVEQAAAPTSSLSFLFYGIGLVVLPVIMVYTAVVYWIFRGKVSPEAIND